jgi:hypothetical protein
MTGREVMARGSLPDPAPTFAMARRIGLESTAMRIPTTTLLLASLLFGCAASPEPAAAPHASDAPAPSGSKATGAQLLRDIEAGGANYVISENKGSSNGLGHYVVQVDGKSIWPPQGDGCAQYIACCNAVTKVSDPLALSCLLALGRDHTCSAAQKTVNQITLEQGVSLPSACPR